MFCKRENLDFENTNVLIFLEPNGLQNHVLSKICEQPFPNGLKIWLKMHTSQNNNHNTSTNIDI